MKQKNYNSFHIFTAVAPIIAEVSDTTLITRGESNQISCTAEGFPAPNITWYHNGTEITDSVSTTTNDVTVISMVVVSMATANDSGLYACNFTSPVAEYKAVSATVEVFVQGKLILQELFML